jgi:flavin reductase (DIM6/NTAB) family NADH-FMN oxidoreductase RutF
MIEKINPEDLRESMRAWITGVAIVTGSHQGTFHGMTANSFNSLALNPPTVLVALRQNTRTQHLVKDGGVFAVSILNAHQEDLAKRFAGQISPELPRFEGVKTFTMSTGAPLIKDAMAFLDCQVVNTFDVGGTSVFIGEVLEAKKAPGELPPLLYFNRLWRKLAE